MDLVDYDLAVFTRVKDEYSAFLREIKVQPIDFVPLCARSGENIVSRAEWWTGATVLEHIDAFAKEGARERQPFRFPVQDIYKFTADNDDRRILAGTVETGKIGVGDEVIFFPSRKRSRIASIEAFHAPERAEISAGYATGFTLTDELYLKPGELMAKASEALPAVSSRFRANVFWMGKAPLVRNKKYKLKLATSRTPVRLLEIRNVLNAAELTAERKPQVDRHEVAECLFETIKPIAFDLSREVAATGRFVLVDGYEIAGGGIIVEAMSDAHASLHDHIRKRERSWERGEISSEERAARHGHRAKFVVITGEAALAQAIARALERRLFQNQCLAYYRGLPNLDQGLDDEVQPVCDYREQNIRELGELARILTDSGQIFITSITDLDAYEAEILGLLNAPSELLIVAAGEHQGTVPAALHLTSADTAAIGSICDYLKAIQILADYVI